MARYMELDQSSQDLAWIWNVSGPVSSRVYSQRPDVMLVQHAINTLMAPLHLKDDRGADITSYLTRDGYIGPKTNAAIAAYQRSLRSRGFLVKADGSVDPASRSGWTSDGNAQFTIVYLNRDHRNIHGKMMEEKDFPELLQNNLIANKGLR
jgi:peptidoglycan hydrolase-like protein with peptidoglycan-binding domain